MIDSHSSRQGFFVSDFQLILYATLQGVTEFIPVSSSAHLVIFPRLLGWEDPGVFMDVAVHVGTLCAVLLYFKTDVLNLFRGVGDLFCGRSTDNRHLLLFLSIATIPLVCAGFFVDWFCEGATRDPQKIAWSSIGFGILLYLADHFSRRLYGSSHITLREGFWGWGMAQALALIPGASRSGVCMTAGRFMGYNRESSARIAFLMAIPAITAAGTLKGIQFCCAPHWALLYPMLGGACISFVVGLGAIKFMLFWLSRFSLTPFVVYRLILGFSILFLGCL